MMKRKLFFVIILFTNQMAGCQTKTYEEKLESLLNHSVPLISTSQLKDIINQETPIVLLDTRSPEEVAISTIAGARFVDYEHFSVKDISDIPKDSDVIVYCSVGYRSEKIGEQLLTLGYKNVKNLYGGIFQWKNDGHEVVNQEGIATDRVHTYNRNWSKWLVNGVKVY